MYEFETVNFGRFTEFTTAANVVGTGGKSRPKHICIRVPSC